jgi:hypothetical protein
VSFITIEEKGSDLVSYLAQEQARKLKFMEKIEFLEKRIKGVDSELWENIKFVSKIRNCLMHNNGIANEELNLKYKMEEKIILSLEEVNTYGHQVRTFAEKM